jgi:hypothetical protein
MFKLVLQFFKLRFVPVRESVTSYDELWIIAYVTFTNLPLRVTGSRVWQALCSRAHLCKCQLAPRLGDRDRIASGQLAKHRTPTRRSAT